MSPRGAGRALPAAVLLAAHGAGDDSKANRRVRQLARRLAARLPGVCIGVGFTLGVPGYAAAASALRRAGGGRLVVVPVLTSEGYFTRRLLPAAALQRGAETRITAALGTHPRVVAGIVATALERLRERPAAEGRIACLVVGHGSERAASSGSATEELGRALRAALTRAGVEVEVATAFLDQEPRLERVAAGLAVARLVVVPFLLGGGPHTERHLGERLARATSVPFSLGRGLLDEPALEGALLAALVERIGEAGAAPDPIERRRAAPRSAPAAWSGGETRLGVW